jgi:hypothetical protein
VFGWRDLAGSERKGRSLSFVWLDGDGRGRSKEKLFSIQDLKISSYIGRKEKGHEIKSSILNFL